MLNFYIYVAVKLALLWRWFLSYSFTVKLLVCHEFSITNKLSCHDSFLCFAHLCDNATELFIVCYRTHIWISSGGCLLGRYTALIKLLHGNQAFTYLSR
jgi:hypothetical protein